MLSRFAPGAQDLLAVALAALLACLLLLTNQLHTGIRAALAIPLVFVLPGYALTAALFPPRIISVAERVTLSLGLSLAITVIGGLVLNFTPAGLRTGTWAIFLLFVTMSASIIALLRRRSAPTASSTALGLTTGQAIMLGSAVCLASVAIVVARQPSTHPGVAGYTQFWMLPSATSDTNMARIGIRNMELTAEQYRVEVSVAGRVIAEWASVDLSSGETWETSVELPAPGSADDTIEALLYRLDDAESIYRRVALVRD